MAVPSHMTNYNQPECFISTKHSYATLICLWYWLPDSSFLCFVKLYYAHCCGIRTYSLLLYLFGRCPGLIFIGGDSCFEGLWIIIQTSLVLKHYLWKKMCWCLKRTKQRPGVAYYFNATVNVFVLNHSAILNGPKSSRSALNSTGVKNYYPVHGTHTLSLSPIKPTLSLSLSHPRHITQANTQAKLYCHLLLTTYLPIAYQMEMVE